MALTHKTNGCKIIRSVVGSKMARAHVTSNWFRLKGDEGAILQVMMLDDNYAIVEYLVVGD